MGHDEQMTEVREQMIENKSFQLEALNDYNLPKPTSNP